ncbi:Cytokine Receptor-Like Factor 2 [Manis pentadactyla]|nr:Cytokine Receptor-Like Factor 2 [Manis pentadactyla]
MPDGRAPLSGMWVVFPARVATAVFLLGYFIALEETDLEEELQLQIINFNYENVWVTWNASKYPGTNLTFFYKLSSDDECGQCPDYIHREGHTAGCLLQAVEDEILHFYIWNGTRLLLSRAQWTSTYLKPSSPKDLAFQWHQEAVTVTCPDLLYKDLLYEMQYKSIFDTEWQSAEEKTCNVTIQGLDAEKCYLFRARVKTEEPSYGPDTYPSDWSVVAHWQRGELRDSCMEEKHFPKFILISSMVAILTLSLLLLSLWKIYRVKKLLMPSVPDPKFTFPGLFECHQGNFQEWIKDTQNVAHVNNKEGVEQEYVLEEALVVQLAKAEAEMPTMTASPLCPRTGEEEDCGDPSQHSCQPPQTGKVVSLGGFTFMTSDNSYVML